MKHAAALLLVALALTGCAHTMTPNEAVTALQSRDADTRRRAADDLRSDDRTGVPPGAVPALLSALASEPELAVRGAILITLGRSGAPEAKAPIDEALATEKDPDMHRWAKRALKYWKIQNDDDAGGGSWSYWVPVWEPTKKAGPN